MKKLQEISAAITAAVEAKDVPALKALHAELLALEEEGFTGCSEMFVDLVPDDLAIKALK